MFTITDDLIKTQRTNPKSELETTYESDIYEPDDKSIRGLLKTVEHLETLSIQEAGIEVLGLITKRFILFSASLSPEHRPLITPIPRLALLNSKNQKQLIKILKFEIKRIPKLHRTICTHFINAFQDFNTATLLSSANLKTDNKAIPMIFFISIQHVYRGDMRLIRESTKTQREVAGQASKARSLQYAPAQHEVILLMKSIAPAGGWTSKAQAAKSIAPELEKIMEQKNIKAPNRVTPSNVQRRLRDWLDKASQVRQAYEENCHPRSFNKN